MTQHTPIVPEVPSTCGRDGTSNVVVQAQPDHSSSRTRVPSGRLFGVGVEGPRPSTSVVERDGPPKTKRKGRDVGGTDAPAGNVSPPRKKTKCSRLEPVQETDGRTEEGESDQDATPEDDREEEETAMARLARHWEKSVEGIRNMVLALPEGEKEVEEEKRAALIGSAFVSFAGPGDVCGVVDLDLDPNKRGNPRRLSDSHVEALYNILRQPDAKRDHESPILLAVPARLLDAPLRDLMRAADAADLLSPLPRLKLENPDRRMTERMENALWLQMEEGAWIPKARLQTLQAELSGLRKRAELCKLLNGHHRIRAMLLLGGEIAQERDRLRGLMERGEDVSGEEWDALTERAKLLTWRCLVYDSDRLTAGAETSLVRNAHDKPALNMGAGEQAWWLGRKFETEIEALMAQGGSRDPARRRRAIDVVQRRWRRSIGVKMTGFEGETDEARGGDGVTTRLFFNPVTMEMVLDCREALWAFEHVLSHAWTVEMLKKSGGAIVAHFWLAVRTLVKVVNVIRGEGLTDAETWVSRTPRLNYAGYQEAVGHFDLLHVRQERVPQLLATYQEGEAQKFGALYASALANHRCPVRGIRYDDADTVVAIRGAFDEFGKWWYGDGKDEHRRRVATSIRLLARLPVFNGTANGSMFYPAAVLPCRSLLKETVERWTGARSVPGNGDCLVLLETLLEPHSMVWTVGARGTSNACNWENWCGRTRGLHRVVQMLVGCRDVGPMEARLSEAIEILEDPRLVLALCRGQEMITRDGRFRAAMDGFSVAKSGSRGYRDAEELAESLHLELGAAAEIKVAMSKARTAVKQAVWTQPGTNRLGSEELLERHPVLGLIDEAFWSRVFPAWFTGWEDSEPKRIQTVGAGLGWGMMDRWLVEVELPRVLEDADVRWILSVSRTVAELTGGTVWWEGLFEQQDTQMPATPEQLPTQLQVRAPAKRKRGSAGAGKKQRGGDAEKPAGNRKGKRRARGERPAEIQDSSDEEEDPPSPLLNADHGGSAPGQPPEERGRPGGLLPVPREAAAPPGDHDFKLPFSERPALVDSGRNLQPPPEGFAYHHSSFVRRGPPYVFAAPIASTSIAHNAWRQLGATREAIALSPAVSRLWDDALVRSLTDAASGLEPALIGLEIHREALRSDLVELCKSVVRMSMGSDVAHALLPDMAAGLKVREVPTAFRCPTEVCSRQDLFVARCAKHLQTVFRTTPEEAVHEAVKMATDDGLMGTDLTKVLHEGTLELNLVPTFPLSVQEEGT
ncbi:hypothetical protein FS749_000182 [Ceratobasidium sp. UAMH 11750]|nr:hypothetical protein FS749_000182 [Ceratobasidium sp. UAMH 11750]